MAETFHAPELTFIDDRLDVAEALNFANVLASKEQTGQDPALKPYAEQVANHLQHVTYDFRIQKGSEDDFPYRLHRTEAYPPEPTKTALYRAQQLFDLTNTHELLIAPTLNLSESYGREAIEGQNKFVKELLADPVTIYDDFTERRRFGGSEASFPELGWTVKGLLYDMATSANVLKACEASPLLTNLRAIKLADLQDVIEEGNFGYRSTLELIEEAMTFFDLVVRVNKPTTPPTYHSKRFEYNWHSFLEDPDHTIIPTMASVNSMDLLRLRGVPIGLVGVSTATITVDGFPQSPFEFFHHDVDHTRRMHEESKLAIEREGVSPRKFYEDSTELLFAKLLPAIDIEGITDKEERDRRIAMRMVLFEILHEDAYDPSADSITEAIMRVPLERTPFEQVSLDGKTIEYFMAPRATTLAHVYRKLAHDFYDFPERRSSNLGSDFARTRMSIAQAAADLYRLVSDDPISDDDLLTTCRELVSTDEGFTDGFKGNIAPDIAKRGVGARALTLMISKPLKVVPAIREARISGKKVHSLFGYSALEYEDPKELERTVLQDLEAFDPEETAIAIGATPYGIGKLYPAIKDLGFFTLGIVANTAVGLNLEATEGVDSIVLVKDSGWGGFKYNQRSGGLLSPTTRVFLGASDSFAAYGGGEITAITLAEAVRRGKKVSFKPFDMNHKNAEISQAQRGGTGTIDYRGPAYARWQELNT